MIQGYYIDQRSLKSPRGEKTMKIKSFAGALSCALICSCIVPGLAHAQGFGMSEYANGGPVPPPPPVGELTKPPLPESPPQSPGDAWQEDGYRDNQNGAPWGAPSWGGPAGYYAAPNQYGAPWSAGDFAPWAGMVVRGYGPQTVDPYRSTTCVDQECSGR